MTTANAHTGPARAPGLIRAPGWMVTKLLELGLPLGPNVLVTMRGRISGEPRTQPLAIFSDGDRRWLIGTFGDTNWCRNMRAHPDIEIRRGRRRKTLRARELPLAEAEEFFSYDLPVGISHMPLYLRLFGRFFLRAAAPIMVSDPPAAARSHPVFELTSPDPSPSATDRRA